jgi:3D (Asp-Asp-Asp) domain-containing protein
MQYDACWARGPVGRLVMAITALCAMLALASCEGSSTVAPALTAPDIQATPAHVVVAPEPAAPTATPKAAAPPGPLGRSFGAFRFTMYYVAEEPQRRVSVDDEVLADVSGAPDNFTLYSKKDCKPLAKVNRAFGHQLDIQGTGKLRDGRVVNTAGHCNCPHSPCYKEIKAAWAMGAGGRLEPFRSVAVDTRVIPMGTVLYIPELDGMTMPGKAPWGGFVHDGCVVAEDRGGGIAGHELDFFAAKKAYVTGLDKRYHLRRIHIYGGKGRCERKGGSVQARGGGST